MKEEIQHLSFNRGQSGLASSIISRVRKTFSLNSDHELDELKIPFSDQNVYSQIISTVASILNKKSVKRKFPGTGQVMVPGYNIMQVFEIDGNIYKRPDIIKNAQQAVKDEIISLDQSSYNDVYKYQKELIQSIYYYILFLQLY